MGYDMGYLQECVVLVRVSMEADVQRLETGYVSVR